MTLNQLKYVIAISFLVSSCFSALKYSFVPTAFLEKTAPVKIATHNIPTIVRFIIGL